VLVLQIAAVLWSTMPSVMKETVMLSCMIVKLTLVVTVSSHEAVNPLMDNTASQHHHQHEHHFEQVKQQQQHEPVHPAAEHHQSARGIDRNAVRDQQ